MTNNVAIDVVIGLIFVFLLYSLLATILSEMIATLIGMRARNLKEAVNRMLNDEENKGFFRRFVDSLNIFKNPRNTVIDNFYNHPEIKYLGSSGIFRNPSAFKAVSFSKTLMHVLFGNEATTPGKIEERLNELLKLSGTETKLLDADTALYIYSLWTTSYGDIVKFKFQLEMWFDRTMEQATEWYKRKIQVVLLFLGFLLAWCFNADTFTIVKTLSTDKEARQQMVDMAIAYVKENKTLIDSLSVTDTSSAQGFSQRLDSLLEIKKEIDADIARANTVLGLGAWPADTIRIITDKKKYSTTFLPALDAQAIPSRVLKNSFRNDRFPQGGLAFTFWAKVRYFFNLFFLHFPGFLVMAFAISLGAPFWFDLLNKLMKLRTSQKIESSSPKTSSGSGGISVIEREG